MRKSRFTEAQIIGMIKEQEAGMPTAEVCRSTWQSRNSALVLPYRGEVRNYPIPAACAASIVAEACASGVVACMSPRLAVPMPSWVTWREVLAIWRGRWGA
jgi:hypothetical protein